MRKCNLPRIKKSNKECHHPLKSIDFSSPFSNLLKQFKLRNNILNIKSPTHFTNMSKSNYFATEINSKNSIELINNTDSNANSNSHKKEDKKLSIEGQKYLIKLYDSNYSSLMDKIKNDTVIDRKIYCSKIKKNLPSIKENEKDIDKENEKDKDKEKDTSIDNMGEKPSGTLSNDSRHLSVKARYGFNPFEQTNYVTPICMRDFYEKYSKYNTISRKYILDNNTPSLAFIKSSNEEKIIPNPLGLIRRSGDITKLNYNYQKVGDDYLKVLSNSLKYTDHLTKIDLTGNRLSTDGTTNLFKTINNNVFLAKKLQSIDLSENNLGNQNLEGLILFLQEQNSALEDLNLYGNLIGDDNTIKICDNIGKYIEHKLISLNLGKNNIHDESASSICNMLKSCTGLRVLNISHNWLHNKPAAQIIHVLNNSYELKILDISWNLIGDDLVTIPTYEELVNSEIKHPDKNFDNFALEEALGSLKIKLRRNPLLPPLDDKNKKDKEKKADNQNTTEEIKEPKKVPLKPKNPSEFAVALGEYFTNDNIDLIHLDISHNSINYIDCKLLSEKVKSNHTILGIHLDGNEMEIDGLGFINPIEKNAKSNKYFCESQISYGINKKYKLRKTTIDTVRKIRSKNNCWICDGFREIEFEYVPEEPLDDPNRHLVKIHLNFDNYKAFDMIFMDGRYHMARMCPPGDIYYFFSIDTELMRREGKEGKNEFKKIENYSEYINYTFCGDYMEELKNIKEKLTYEIRNASNINIVDLTKTPTADKTKKKRKSIVLMNTTDSISINVDTLCKMHIKHNNNVIDENYRKLFKFSVPRPEKNINKFVKPRTPWSFPLSIWAYYGYDYNDVSNSYLSQCFKFDFERCQFQKDFKTEESLDLLRLFLKERYRDIIDCYKYYSSLSGFSVWQITQNNLSEFINHCNGFCDKNYDINNVFLIQKTVCGNLIDKEDRKKKNKNLSDNLVRHQFMNLLVKVSKDKYITVLKTLQDPFEAVEAAFENHFDEAIKGFSYHKWRQERYYNEKVDNFLKTYLPIFDALYLSWAKQKGPTKKEVWMLLDEFNSLIQNIVDVNEYPIRENPYIFNMSMHLQVNEIYTEKHLNMLLPEFLEALCRAIDKASPYPPSENKEDWPMDKRMAQPLVNKLENILPLLMKLITHPDYKLLKDKFPVPTKEITTGLYIPNFDSQFYQGYRIKTNKDEKDLEIKEDEDNDNENSKVSSIENHSDENENEAKKEKKEEKEEKIEKDDKGNEIKNNENDKKDEEIINIMRNEMNNETQNDNNNNEANEEKEKENDINNGGEIGNDNKQEMVEKENENGDINENN